MRKQKDKKTIDSPDGFPFTQHCEKIQPGPFRNTTRRNLRIAADPHHLYNKKQA
jgi:hypothetical protein